MYLIQKRNGMRSTGTYKAIGGITYFIPSSLPPTPPLELDAESMTLYGEASFALGQLNEMCKRLPDPQRFIKAYVIKEALLSSAIEGIHTTLIEVFTHPLGEAKPSKETQLVLNYTKALDAALDLLTAQGVPLGVRILLKSHEMLMAPGGNGADPGNFRKQSVRVGELIPPPPSEVPSLMGDLEKYIHKEGDLPLLIKAGLVHVQFETIHPFLDGNGRIGRLLIVLMLLEGNLLSLPILYPSYYFKKHCKDYYQKLDRVRTHGDFEGWIKYYLKALKESALDAHVRAKALEELETDLIQKIQSDEAFAKMRETALSVLDSFFVQPISTVTEISTRTGKAYNTVQNILKQFLSQGIISETIIHKRNKLYRFEPYLRLLEEDYASSR